MKYFPLFADLDKAHVLVAGGGEQATQKVRLLLKTNAQITVVADTVTDELRELEEENAIWIVLRTVLARDLDGDPVFLAQDSFSLRYEAERYPAIKMVAIKEYHVAKAA